MLISCQRVTARMLVSLGNQQEVNFTQPLSSKMLISRQETIKINIDFTVTRDGKDVDDLETSKMLISRKA